jgi:Na+/H+ antiporter
MPGTIQIVILLMTVVAGVAIVSPWLRTAPSILLVLAGVGLAIAPGLPTVTLAPEFVLLTVMPPIIYASAVTMSWRDFRFNLRPITLLALGCVVFTTVAVAAAAHELLGLSWPIGFLIGAIVSPPDPVAPLSIASRLKIPRRILIILEGEGVANDATALILYRFAVVAVSMGSFSAGRAVGAFTVMVAGELTWGLGVGWAILRLRRLVKDPSVEILLSLLTPFLAYLPPQHLGGSGVLATVATGLYLSWNGPRLISAATRVRGMFFWEFLIYLIEGMVFLVTGLQARQLIATISAYPAAQLAFAAAVICGVVIVARFLWVFPATYLPRWIIPALRRKDPTPPWQGIFAIGFTGIRGIVSLAAALSIPLTTRDGQPFPYRDLILFLAFSVILVTLVGQGLLLPLVFRGLGLAGAGAEERLAARKEEGDARRRAIEAAISHLGQLKAGGQFPATLTAGVQARHRARLKHLERRTGDEADLTRLDDELELALVAEERRQLNQLHRERALNDEARRRIERELDLRETTLASQSED